MDQLGLSSRCRLQPGLVVECCAVEQDCIAHLIRMRIINVKYIVAITGLVLVVFTMIAFFAYRSGQATSLAAAAVANAHPPTDEYSCAKAVNQFIDTHGYAKAGFPINTNWHFNSKMHACLLAVDYRTPWKEGDTEYFFYDLYDLTNTSVIGSARGNGDDPHVSEAKTTICVFHGSADHHCDSILQFLSLISTFFSE